MNQVRTVGLHVNRIKNITKIKGEAERMNKNNDNIHPKKISAPSVSVEGLML